MACQDIIFLQPSFLPSLQFRLSQHFTFTVTFTYLSFRSLYIQFLFIVSFSHLPCHLHYDVHDCRNFSLLLSLIDRVFCPELACSEAHCSLETELPAEFSL
jgi:hypothetical protein